MHQPNDYYESIANGTANALCSVTTELAASIVLTGHTHVAKIEKLGRSVHVNPGHLKDPKLDRGQRPSYAIVSTTPDNVTISIHELNGRARTSQTFARAELA